MHVPQCTELAVLLLSLSSTNSRACSSFSTALDALRTLHAYTMSHIEAAEFPPPNSRPMRKLRPLPGPAAKLMGRVPSRPQTARVYSPRTPRKKETTSRR